MKNVKMTICLMSAVLFMATGQVFGLTQYKDGDTHNIDYPLWDDVWVDYLSPSMQTTVNLHDNSAIHSPYKLQAYQDSQINIVGSQDYLISIGPLNAFDNSRITMSGGTGQTLYTYNNSQLAMSGGRFNFLYAYDNSQYVMSGGIAIELYAYNSSQIIVSNFTSGAFFTCDNSHVMIMGGYINGNLNTDGNSHVTIAGGIIDNYIFLKDDSIIVLNGANFAIDGTPFVSGEITSILGGTLESEPHRWLTGTLANGDIINNQFKIGDTAKIVLIPEPCTMLLLGLGGMLIRKR